MVEKNKQRMVDGGWPLAELGLAEKARFCLLSFDLCRIGVRGVAGDSLLFWAGDWHSREEEEERG